MRVYFRGLGLFQEMGWFISGGEGLLQEGRVHSREGRFHFRSIRRVISGDGEGAFQERLGSFQKSR